MKVLAIDPSSKCGWAYFDGPRLIQYGVVHSAVKACKWVRLDDTFQLFNTLLKTLDVEVIVVEDILPVVRHTPSMDGLFWTMAMYLNAGVIATDAKLPLHLAPISSIKKNIAPDWRVHDRPKTKWPIVEAVNKRFNLSLKLKNNNEADAIAIGCWYIDTKLC